jgi:hypothetical protein
VVNVGDLVLVVEDFIPIFPPTGHEGVVGIAVEVRDRVGRYRHQEISVLVGCEVLNFIASELEIVSKAVSS